jgi:outer membrane lipoprotein SlyB
MGPADPLLRQKQTETEMKLRYGGESDPERPPNPEPGDKYITLGAIVGLVVGGVAGAFIGGSFSFLGGIIGASVGIIGGGILGVQIGRLVKKRRQQAEDDKGKRPSTPIG